jgi:serine/threonine protein kinase, bacterial
VAVQKVAGRRPISCLNLSCGLRFRDVILWLKEGDGVDTGDEGTTFGPYRLIALLGRGGTGEVWRGYDPAKDGQIAVKVLPAGFAGDRVFRDRFLREVRASAALTEPHVIPIYDYGELDGRLFVSMKLVEGRNLQGLIANGPLPPARAVAIIDQVASALQAAHDVGLVHGDVKPSNILVDQNDFAYLIDFGLAPSEAETGPTNTDAPTTWAYMAPERFESGVAWASWDVYALACVLYQSLTGELPFAGDTAQIVAAHLLEPPPKPSRFGIPAWMDEVIATGMAKTPGGRYSRTTELTAAARIVVNAEHVPHPPAQEGLGAASDSSLSTQHPPDSKLVTHYAAVYPGSDVLRAYTAAELQLPLTGTDGVIHHLPFDALKNPTDVAVDAAGTVYVADSDHHEGGVFKLAAGASTAVRLPFGRFRPFAVAVDRFGTVYTSGNDAAGVARWLQLAPGATRAVELTVPGLRNAADLAVDGAGDLLLIDWQNNRVLKMRAHDLAVAQLPFRGLKDICGLTADNVGNIYVTADLDGVQNDNNNWVFRLAPGQTRPTQLPFAGLNYGQRLAVDADGNIYAADNYAHRVVKLTPDGATAAQLPFPHIQGANGVAVDSHGNVYATDPVNNRVLKLAIQTPR